jgi:hypothetical protein
MTTRTVYGIFNVCNGVIQSHEYISTVSDPDDPTA